MGSLAYLIGVMLGDGGVYGNSYTVFCRDRNREFVERCGKLVEQIFGIKPNLRRVAPNCWAVTSNQREIHRLLRKLGYPKGRKLTTAKIPKAFLGNQQSELEIVRGLFDTEGYCGIDTQTHGARVYTYPYVGIDMIAKPVITEVQRILRTAGIESSIRVKKARGWGKHPQWSLVVKGFQRVRRFQEVVGFRHPEKKEKLRRLVEGGSSETVRRASSREDDDTVHPSRAREGRLR